MPSNIDILRALINDQAKAEFPDDSTIQTFLSTAATIEGVDGDGNILLAASLAVGSLVGKYASVETKSLNIGGFQTTVGRSQVRMLEQQRQAFYQMYLDQPAFAIAEESSTDLNYWLMIRNQILKEEI